MYCNLCLENCLKRWIGSSLAYDYPQQEKRFKASEKAYDLYNVGSYLRKLKDILEQESTHRLCFDIWLLLFMSS